MNILPAVLFFIIPLAFAQGTILFFKLKPSSNFYLTDYLVYEQDGKFQIDSLIDNIFETNLHPANITYYFQKPNNSSLVFKYTEADQLLKKVVVLSIHPNPLFLLYTVGRQITLHLSIN